MDFKVSQQSAATELLQKVNINMLKKSMDSQAKSVDTVVNAMADSSSKALENSVTPHKGTRIDAKV